MDDARRRLVHWSRMIVVLLVLFAFVIVPFLIWGDQMDASAPKLVQGQATKWAIAVIGIGLLVADVLLPIPSSVVSISLCLLLGPGFGGLAVFTGMVGAFAAGYLVGHLLPAARLRSWVGAQTWDAFASKRLPAGLLWIAASRPVPVLAEVTAIFAGSVGMPFLPSLSVAALSSLLVSIAYGLAGWLGLQQADSSTALLVFSAACLPAVSWGIFQWIRRSMFAL
jgi:uncharacterized membrane protein YdjX (TVP38/TMEM64 family)